MTGHTCFPCSCMWYGRQCPVILSYPILSKFCRPGVEYTSRQLSVSLAQYINMFRSNGPWFDPGLILLRCLLLQGSAAQKRAESADCLYMFDKVRICTCHSDNSNGYTENIGMPCYAARKDHIGVNRRGM